MNKKTLFILSAVILLLAFLLGTLVYKSERVEQSGQGTGANRADGVRIDRPAQLPERFSANLVRMHSPALGNSDAPVVIVEFFDPACEACRAFYPLVKRMIAENPGRIRLVLRYAPFHQGSDKVVAVLEAARKQDKFWPVLETLLGAQAEWTPHHRAQVDLIWKHLGGIGLNLEQLKSDMAAREIADVIAQDLDDARMLKVTKTPEFFVNGKPLPEFGYEELKALVDQALASAAR